MAGKLLQLLELYMAIVATEGFWLFTREALTKALSRSCLSYSVLRVEGELTSTRV